MVSTTSSAIRRAAGFLFLCAAGIFCTAPSFAQLSPDLIHFDIPAQSLSNALTQFGRDTGVEIVFSPEAVVQKTSNAVKGDFRREKAIALLLIGTGLTFRITSTGALIVDAPLGPRASGDAIDQTDISVRVAQSNSTSTQPEEANNPTSLKNATPLPGFSSRDGADKSALEEVIVTGSRIPHGSEGPQQVKVFGRQQIEQSGQTSVASFLSTLPDVSVAAVDNTFQTANGASTVQLHGLPMGTTLILINGRRVEVNGLEASNTFNVFDLNDIPLAAVERVEVVSEGSSAVYGSDAIAGVINIILKTNFDGLEAGTKYGFANGTDEWDSSLAWGQRFDKGSFSIIGSFQARSELQGIERSITAN